MKSCLSIFSVLLFGGIALRAETTKLDLEGAFADVYKNARGDDLYLYEGQPHGFFNEAKAKASSETFFDSLRKMDHVFVELDWLKSEPSDEQLQAISKQKPK